jgi:hypothetical protein
LEKVGVGKVYMEENCGGGQSLNSAVEPRREGGREREFEK